MKNFIGIALGLMACTGVAFLFFRAEPVGTPPAPPAGGTGSEHRQLENFYGDITIAGNRIASSTSASVTLSGSEFTNASILDYTVNVANKTLTLAASTTPLCSSLTTNERRKILIRHASTTAANTLTFAGGTGITMLSASSSKALHGRTDGYAMAQIDLIRLPSTDCEAMLTLYND